jgi:hypothetical protein
MLRFLQNLTRFLCATLAQQPLSTHQSSGYNMSEEANENANKEASIAPRFALVPSAIAGIIDYSTRQGLNTYRVNTRLLYNNPEDAYDLESIGLQTFLGLLSHCAKSADWDFEVPVDLSDPMVGLLDFLDNHGQFTLDHLGTPG